MYTCTDFAQWYRLIGIRHDMSHWYMMWCIAMWHGALIHAHSYTCAHVQIWHSGTPQLLRRTWVIDMWWDLLMCDMAHGYRHIHIHIYVHTYRFGTVVHSSCCVWLVSLICDVTYWCVTWRMNIDTFIYIHTRTDLAQWYIAAVASPQTKVYVYIYLCIYICIYVYVQTHIESPTTAVYHCAKSTCVYVYAVYTCAKSMCVYVAVCHFAKSICVYIYAVYHFTKCVFGDATAAVYCAKSVCVCVCVCVDLYIYINIHIHTYRFGTVVHSSCCIAKNEPKPAYWRCVTWLIHVYHV